jgi:maltooligosyltrehalose trehalohydrolase
VTVRFRHQLPFGATLLDPNQTRFRLFAPAQSAVTVEIEGAPPVAMEIQPGGWFEAIANCGAGTRYRYRLATGERVPDPASRTQANDVHDHSVVIDPTAYPWRHHGWQGRPWHETILYELHCGLLGGFPGVARELARLAHLGVTAVELMPISDFSGRRNWGYDGVLPFAPDTAYGTVNELKELVDTAHHHGLMIFLDVVYNHFGPDGNYLAAYAPEFFRDDIHTPWGAAIDFRRPEVRRFFTENALYWLMEYRFDGLRLDAVHAISEPDWLDEMARKVRATVEPGRHVHLVLENDANIAQLLRGDFDAQWNDDIHHVLHVLLTGEHEGYYADYADNSAAKLVTGLSEGFIYQGDHSRYRDEPRGTPSADLPPTDFVQFLQNHDQIGNRAFGERLTALSNPAALEAATALQLLAPQIPLIFMGEERASKTPFLYFCDYHGPLADAVRDGRSREFSKFAAFQAAGGQIPDPNALSTFEASISRPDPNLGAARYQLFQQLLAIRKAEIVPRLAGARSLPGAVLGEAAVSARWRMADSAILSINVNLSVIAVGIEPSRGKLLFESAAGAATTTLLGSLPAQTAVVFLEIPP